MKKGKAMRKAAKLDKKVFGRRGGRKQPKAANIGIVGGKRQKDALVDW